VGVILSGSLDDGSAGLIAIKKQGGIAVVQDPGEALYSEMPRSAIESLDVDHILTVSEMSSVLVRLTREPVEERGGPESEDLETESDIAELDFEALNKYERPGIPSRFTCPDCHGVLWEIDDERLLRFRCRVGHAYSSENLLGGQADAVEDALWAALRTLEENVALLQRMSDRMQRRSQATMSDRFARRAMRADQRAEVLRQLLSTRGDIGPLETKQFS